MPFLAPVLAAPALALSAAAAWQAPQPADALERFFAGRTEGAGAVRIMLSGSSQIRSQGRGRILPDGTLVLDHVVHQAGAPERRRTWRMRRTGPGRYTGTITDGRGPVTAQASGNRVQISYRTVEGHAIDQQLTIAPDGRSATSRIAVRRLGLQVATLQETIRKLD